MKIPAAAALAVISTLLLSADAVAAISVTRQDDIENCDRTGFCQTDLGATSVRGSAAPDTVLVRPVPGRLRYEDPAGAAAGSGCTQVSPTVAECAAGPVAIDTLAGDDRVDAKAATLPVTIAGGSEKDTLLGGFGADTLDGGVGDDRLEGGAGRDLLSYEGRREAVNVDLARGGLNGARGENDTTVSIENVTGGDGDDRLAGDDARNVLEGGRGLNVLAGRGGNDVLKGGSVQSGGSGNDYIQDGHLRTDCGPGHDDATVADRMSGCERVSMFAGNHVHPLRFRERLPSLRSTVALAPFRDACISQPRRGCTASVRIRVRSRGRFRTGRGLIGSDRARFRRSGAVRVRLNARGRRLLSRRKALPVRVELRFRDPDLVGEDGRTNGSSFVSTLRISR